MFKCDQCDKQYAYVHKLQHHLVWNCKGNKSETHMLSSPRRSGSSNCFVLPPTHAKGDDDVELVGAQREKDDNDIGHFEERERESEVKGVEEQYICNECEKGFHSKNARRKHKKKYHRHDIQEVGKSKLRPL